MTAQAPLLFFLAAMVAHAAVDGTVINRTSGKPQAGAAVNLIDLSAGMSPAASAKTDVAGKFGFDKNLKGPQLVQATVAGVTYNRIIPPGTPSTGLEISVFDSSAKPGLTSTGQHMMLIEVADQTLQVAEMIILKNDGNVTFNDDKNGTLRFYLPPAAGGKVTVSVNSQGMPVTRTAEKTGQPDVYMVKYPIRPGETRFDLAYAVPGGNPATLTGKILQDGPTRLVVPNGVTLEGADIQSLGQEPQTKASIFDLKKKTFTVKVTGSGTLRAAAPPQPEASTEDSGPEIQEIKPHIYDRLYYVLGLGFAILAIGFVLLWRHQPESGASSVRDKRK